MNQTTTNPLRITMWKIQDFSVTQILCEINFGHFEAPKSANLTNSAARNFEFLGIFDIVKCDIFPKIKIQCLKNCETTVYDLLKSAKLDFTSK